MNSQIGMMLYQLALLTFQLKENPTAFKRKELHMNSLWHDEIYELVVEFQKIMAARGIQYDEQHKGHISITRSTKEIPGTPGLVLYGADPKYTDFVVDIVMMWPDQNEALSWLLNWFNNVIQGKPMTSLAYTPGPMLCINLSGYLEGLTLLGKPHNIMLNIKSAWAADYMVITKASLNK